VGYRIQGVLLRSKPDEAGLAVLEKAYGYKLFELTGRGLWLLDLGVPVPAPGDLKTVKAARPLASSYVDALRVIGCDEEPLEQLAWLTAAAAAARHLRQPVLAFLSDDEEHDFVAIVTPEGVGVIGDRLRGYLLRWEGGALVIQPFVSSGTGQEPLTPPDELALIPKASLLPTETLAAGGYPLHGNVLAEIGGFAQGDAPLGIGTWSHGPQGSLHLIEAKGLSHSGWDRAAGAAPRAK
jgi:hypothetical protein